MEHRHLFGTPQMFENDHGQSWNMHEEQPHGHIARGTAGENVSFLCPAENVSPEGGQFASHWNLAPISHGYIPICHNDQLQPCQTAVPSPSQDPFIPLPNVGTFDSVPENYFPHASSSNYNGPMDITKDSGRAHQKRKCLGIPAVCGRGDTSRDCCSGNFSDIPAFSEFRQDMLTVDAQHMAWDHLPDNNPGYRDNGLPVRGEGSVRNIRSRLAIDFKTNSVWNHLPDIPALTTGQPIEHSGLVDIPGPSSGVLTTEWRHVGISPAHGRILLPDPRGFSHELTHFVGGSNTSTAPSNARGYDFMTTRNPVVPQLYHGCSNQSLRGHCSIYSHRSTPGFRPSNNMRLANASLLEDGPQSVADNHSRHPKLLHTVEWRNSDRTRRSRIKNERYRSFPGEAGVHDRIGYEAFTIVDRPALHVSRDMLDQHRDLRLDIDNMNYEELLELGERIGTVSTGLSEDSISKCLKKTMHCSSGQMQDKESCIICLEAYREADKVGTLKTCAHHYHVSCIKKWLSMKNLCPICKASVLPDDMKDK